MPHVRLFLIAVAVFSMLSLHASHADEGNPSFLTRAAASQATVPDIAGTWIAGDVGYLKRVIRRLDDGTGDYELLPPPGAGRKGENLRLKWSTKDRKFIGERASIDGKRRSITLIEPDGKDLRVTLTFDEESLKEMPPLGDGRSFPHVERWRRFESNATPNADKKDSPAWETESQRLRQQIEIHEEAAVAEAAAIRELGANARGKSAQASLLRRKAALEKSLQEIFSLKLELDQGQLHSLKSRLATLESQIEQRRQSRDRIVERRLQELLELPAVPPPTDSTKTCLKFDHPGKQLKRIAYSPSGVPIAAVADHGAVVCWSTAEPAETSDDCAAPPSDDQTPPQPRDQAIHPQGGIRGQLLDEAGKPVSGAIVACGAFINETGGGGTRDVTDVEGRFRLLVPSPGIYIVFLKELKRDRKLVVVADDSVLVEAGRVATSRLTLSTGRKVSGTVVDGDGKPIGALRVRYYSPASPNSIGGGQSVYTNDRGEFDFFVPPGRLDVEVLFAKTRDDVKFGRARTVIPADGKVPPLRLSLKPSKSKFGDPAWIERSTPGTKIVRHEDAADVTGIVVDDQGAPLAGAKVFREGSPVIVTDKDGKFRMPAEKGTQFVMHAFAVRNRVWFGTPTAGDQLRIVLEKKDGK